jgi:hypothetical protein
MCAAHTHGPNEVLCAPRIYTDAGMSPITRQDASALEQKGYGT